MRAGGECQASGSQPGRVRPAEGQADRAARTSVLVCHSSRARHCKFAWCELCAVMDKLFLVSESVCLVFAAGEQVQGVPASNGREESHQI